MPVNLFSPCTLSKFYRDDFFDGINMRLRLLLSLRIKNKKFLNTFHKRKWKNLSSSCFPELVSQIHP